MRGNKKKRQQRARDKNEDQGKRKEMIKGVKRAKRSHPSLPQNPLNQPPLPPLIILEPKTSPRLLNAQVLGDPPVGRHQHLHLLQLLLAAQRGRVVERLGRLPRADLAVGEGVAVALAGADGAAGGAVGVDV